MPACQEEALRPSYHTTTTWWQNPTDLVVVNCQPTQKNQPKFHKVNKNSKNFDQFIAKKSKLVKRKPESSNLAQLIQQQARDVLCFSPYQKPVKRDLPL